MVDYDREDDIIFATVMANLLVKGDIEYTDDTHALLTERGWSRWEKIRDTLSEEDILIIYLRMGQYFKSHFE